MHGLILAAVPEQGLHDCVLYTQAPEGLPRIQREAPGPISPYLMLALRMV